MTGERGTKMTTILDIVDNEALAREEAYERAEGAVTDALAELGSDVHPAELEAYIAARHHDIGEVAIMLAVSAGLNR